MGRQGGRTLRCRLIPPDPPTDLFFSEYVEGSGSNKALEIYNGTTNAVNLGDGKYEIQLFLNGSGTPGTTITLSNLIAPGDVFVIANSGAASGILALADRLAVNLNFNGDDAVALVKNGVVIDVIGQIGFDPGTEWGSGTTTTADHTLRRNVSISAGDNNGSDAIDPGTQ